MFTLILALIFILPGKIMVVTGLYISILTLLWDRFSANRSIVNWVVAMVNFSVCFAYYVLGLDSILPYMGNFFYSALAIVAIGSGIIGKPISLSRPAVDKWELKFHVRSVYVVGAFQLIALALSIGLMPNIAYVILPMLVSVSSAALSFRLVKAYMDWLDARVTARNRTA